MFDWYVTTALVVGAFMLGAVVSAIIAERHEAREDSENVRAAYRWGDQWKARYEALFGPRVSRVEIIDEHGREYVAYGVRVRSFELQDESQTLKVFLETRPHMPPGMYSDPKRHPRWGAFDLEPTGEIAVVPWGVTDEANA